MIPLIGIIAVLTVFILLLISISNLGEIIIEKLFKKNVSRKKIFILILLIGILIFPSLYILKIIEISITETIVNNNYKNQTYIEFDENSLIKAFINDEYTINKKINKKIILINGNISDTGRPKDNIPVSDSSYIVFGYDPYIICYFNSIVVDDLNEGELISIIGKYRKYISHEKNRNVIVIGDCRIIKK